MGPRGRQKPSLLLVVAGGCRDLLLRFSRVCKILSFLFGKSVHVTIFSSVTVIIVFSYKLYLWLGYDILHMYHSVKLYVYVDTSYRSLSGGLLHFRGEGRSSPGREAWGLVGGRSRDCCTWWQERVEVFFSRVCKIRHFFCLENPFMSRFCLLVSVIGFPHG